MFHKNDTQEEIALKGQFQPTLLTGILMVVFRAAVHSRKARTPSATLDAQMPSKGDACSFISAARLATRTWKRAEEGQGSKF